MGSQGHRAVDGWRLQLAAGREQFVGASGEEHNTFPVADPVGLLDFLMKLAIRFKVSQELFNKPYERPRTAHPS